MGSSVEQRQRLAIRLAIQGELGSNSHRAALEVSATAAIVPCGTSAEVFEALAGGAADQAVLPIENSLHGAVFEHYDLLLEQGTPIVGEVLLRIEHHVIAAPGVRLDQIRRISSHPVALSQCRRWLREHSGLTVSPTYDTAGSVKLLMASGARDQAGIAPAMAAEVYGAEILVPGIEDHAENYTRFLVLAPAGATHVTDATANKLSLAFTLEHRPGSLIEALIVLRDHGLDLTKIESRPVPGRPWEYVFFIDARLSAMEQADAALASLGERCERVELLGRYPAATSVT